MFQNTVCQLLFPLLFCLPGHGAGQPPSGPIDRRALVSRHNPLWCRNHPAVTGAWGMLPGPLDRAVMRTTFQWIWDHWNWPTTWGWDYPLLAMCAARLEEPEKAVEALFLDTPKNQYRRNGHNHQRPGLTIYLPGNGGLLMATAMMAAGWEGAPARHTPGFPANGQWRVRWEGLRPMP